MFVPECLTSHRGFPSQPEAALWSATCSGHPRIRKERGQWVVHYALAWIVMDGDPMPHHLTPYREQGWGLVQRWCDECQMDFASTAAHEAHLDGLLEGRAEQESDHG